MLTDVCLCQERLQEISFDQLKNSDFSSVSLFTASTNPHLSVLPFCQKGHRLRLIQVWLSSLKGPSFHPLTALTGL